MGMSCECECMHVCWPDLCEECIDTRQTTIPCILQILQCQSSILCIRFLSLQCIFSPHTLGISELTLPWLNVTKQIGDEGILVLSRHTSTKVCNTCFSLCRPTTIGLRNQHMTHGNHPETTQLL